MKTRTLIFLAVAVGAYLVFATSKGRRKKAPLHVTSRDLTYQEHSSDDLASEHLLDLNAATCDDLSRLGLSKNTIDRIVDNRPYRNKLELVSRMVLSPSDYHQFKDHFGIAGASEPVKLAL